jgi:hypothetical protein
VLVFVIPLQNPETAQDWARCNALCQQTVRSALNQTNGDVRVIVVGKDFTPDISDNRLTVLRQPFPTPANTWEDRHKDKYRKIAVGLIEARKFAPCYVMKLDADDLLSRNLSSIVHAANHKSGYFIARGYRWAEGSRFVQPVADFHLSCGSSNIIWCAPHELPFSEEDDMSAFPILRFGHNITVDGFARLGRPLKAITSPAAIYRVGHGENITQHLSPSNAPYNRPNWKFYLGRLLDLRKLRPLTPSMRREFFG